MDSKTRATLLERLCDGADPLAWDEFFDRYWRLIFAFARRRGCSDHTAEEIVQEVMLAVFQERDVFSYDPARGRFRDWLGGVVRNKVAQHRRRGGNRLRAPGGDSECGPIELQADDDPPEDAWQTAFEEALLTVLLDVVRREMNPRTYQAFELFALHELSGKAVARLTGLTRNAVYQARKNVLARLKDLGWTYREDGQLSERIKKALESCPAAAVQRSLTNRIAATVRPDRSSHQ